MALEYPWTDVPARGEAIDVAPGVTWIRMPLPFQLDHINLWLLEDGAGFTVVDTGVGLDDTRAAWERLLAERMGGRPVTRLVVTHFHPDHMGNAAWLGERFGAAVWCTQAEWLSAQYARRTRDERDLDIRLAHYRRNGAPPESIERLRQRGNHYPGLVPAVPSDYRPIAGDDILTIGGRRWQAIIGRGHSPEHLALWSAEAGLLISGDQVLPKISTNVSVWPEQRAANPLRLYLESLERFRPVTAEALVLPAHGLPFRGLPERVSQLRDHHGARLAETLDAITEPRSAAEVIPILFRRPLDAHQLGFAMGEALAHLHFLEADGRAVRVIGSDGVHRFRKD
jgi:glyoxylase-like metal-dependent hydrolase (beta-lactamase superfamily II)